MLPGRTPGKDSATGKEVLERMKKNGEAKEIDGVMHIKSREDGNWYPLDEKIHMAHDIHPDYWPTVDGVKVPARDAVTWWNEMGRVPGARSDAARTMMLDSRNYYLELGSHNSSAGASPGQGYQPPLRPPGN